MTQSNGNVSVPTITRDSDCKLVAAASYVGNESGHELSLAGSAFWLDEQCHPKTERERLEIHVLPVDFDAERARSLMDRYCALIESGQHPPFPYIAALFREIDGRVQARRESEVRS